MTRQEHLLTIAMEECCEVAQRLSKAKRFGMDEVQPGQAANNRARVLHELADLFGVLRMLDLDAVSAADIDNKIAKVEHFLEYSKQVGTLAP